MLSVEALLFDLDGTLIDSKKDIAQSIHHLQAQYGRPPSSEAEIARFIGDGVVKLVERAIGARPADELEKAVADYKAHYHAHAFDHTYVYPGVAETLSHFRSKKMAVVTNKPARISKRLIEGLGLGAYFPVVLGGDSLPRKKPHPDSLVAAMEQLGVTQPGGVAMVGDSYQDVVAGRAAGVLTIGVFSNIGDRDLLIRSQPDHTIDSLTDLIRIIK